jgi:hypothetical protein
LYLLPIETAIASKAFEPSKQQSRKWVTAYAQHHFASDRRGLNSAQCEKRAGKSSNKPFDLLAEGLISKESRGDKTAIELFMSGIRGLGGRIVAILRQVAG